MDHIVLYKEENDNTHLISFTLYRDPQFKEMLDLMAMLKKGYCDSVKVRIGRLQNLIASSCIGMKINMEETSSLGFNKTVPFKLFLLYRAS